MEIKFWRFGTWFLLTLVLAACAAQPTAAPNVQMQQSTDAGPAGAQTATLGDLNSLVAALQSAGMMVETGGPVDQAFFSMPGQILRVNGADVQVFQYDTAEAMEAEAAKVAADGSSIGTSMVDWVEPPHFFKTGRLLVLYVGQNQKIIDILSNILGQQFAGR